MNSHFFCLLFTACYYLPLVVSIARNANHHNYLSMTIHNSNQVLCQALCHHSPKCQPKVKVLAQTTQNMTEERGNVVKVLDEGKFFVLCFLKSEENHSSIWIKKSFLSQKVKSGENDFMFYIIEIGNRKMKSRDSLNPQIHVQPFGLENERFSVNCSINLPIRENQNLKLIRVSPEGIKTEFPLNALKLSADFNDEASKLTIKYNLEFLFTEEYVNNTFECVAKDVFTGKYRTAVSQKLRGGVKCSEQLIIKKIYSVHAGNKSWNSNLQLQCSCPGTFPEPEIYWRKPSKEIVSGHTIKAGNVSGNYCCSAIQRFMNGRFHKKGCLHINENVVFGSCQEWKDNRPNSTNGIYNLNIKGKTMKVFCDMESYDQEWIVIQRRLNGSQPFDKSWDEYKNGFGDLNGEFWLGNEKLHQLTNAGSMKIRFDLWDKDDNHTYAEYSDFSVGPESDNYRLKISGHSGSVRGHMRYSGNMFPFSTKDRDNDANLYGSCSKSRGDGGWWFKDCGLINLNGKYGKNSCSGPYWYGFKKCQALKKTTILLFNKCHK